jgi:hypothetical protein
MRTFAAFWENFFRCGHQQKLLSYLNDKERERRANMEYGHLKERVIGQFVVVVNEQECESINPHEGKSVLYLKSWGSDYPYLRGAGEQRRWLPVPVDPKR